MWVYFAAGIITIVLLYKVKNWLKKYRREQKFRRAIKKEEEAAILLKKNGYEIIEYHPELCYNVTVEKEEYSIRITPDYRVRKNNKEFIVEVKTGEFAPDITSRSTRRQLLEYFTISDAEGVLLVNMEKEEICSVKFNTDKITIEKMDSAKDYVIAFLICIILILIIVLYFKF